MYNSDTSVIIGQLICQDFGIVKFHLYIAHFVANCTLIHSYIDTWVWKLSETLPGPFFGHALGFEHVLDFDTYSIFDRFPQFLSVNYSLFFYKKYLKFYEDVHCVSQIKFLRGSEIENLFCEIYAESCVPHLLSGKVISRSLRARFLVEAALTSLLLTMSVEKGLIKVSSFATLVKMEGQLWNSSDEQDNSEANETYRSINQSLEVLKQNWKKIPGLLPCGYHMFNILISWSSSS